MILNYLRKLTPLLDPDQAQAFCRDRPWLEQSQVLDELKVYLHSKVQFYRLLLTQLQSPLRLSEQVEKKVSQFKETLARQDNQANRILSLKLDPHQQQILLQMGFQSLGQLGYAYFGIVQPLYPREDERVQAFLQAKQRRMEQRIELIEKDESLDEQVQLYRERMKQRCINQSSSLSKPSKADKKLITFDEIVSLRQKDLEKALPKIALKLTNQFRIKNKLRAVQWCDKIAAICLPHSINMAARKVPFDHVGFNNRVKAIPYATRSACQNLAYNNYPDEKAAEAAVQGWIKSPGHCKNLKSNSQVCGIAVAKSKDGRWYFTQIFALKS